MNKLIKWVTDLYYNNQRRPDEPEVTYQEEVAEPVEEKDPLKGYDILYWQKHQHKYMRSRWRHCHHLFVTTDYKTWCIDGFNTVKEFPIGIPVISLMKYIDKMFAKMEVMSERIDGVGYYQVGDYKFSDRTYNDDTKILSEIYKTVSLTSDEAELLERCVYWNITQYRESIDKQNRQAMEDKLQGLLKDLE